MDGVHPDLVIGPSTEIIAGNGKILTAGAIDCHVHLICPQIARRGARRRASPRSSAAAPARPRAPRPPPSRPAPWYLARDARVARRAGRSTSRCSARATPSSADAHAGAAAGRRRGFKLHEDWGTTPAAIDACLRVADADRRAGRDPHRHAQRGRLRREHARRDRRPVDPHVPHRGRGRRPRARHHHRRRRSRNVLPSSTNPTRPHTVNTVDEHLDMLMVCHHLNPSVPEDLAFAESRIRPSTIAAEDVLHDLGAISMIGSDSQAMGRVGEVVLRTWQTAHVDEAPPRARCPATVAADNQRAQRYVAKYTICPAIAHGLDGEVGSVEPGKLADLVLWDPAFFGVRPHARAQGRDDRVGARWATPTRRSRRRSRCCPARCSARSAGAAGGHVGRLRRAGRARGRARRPARPCAGGWCRSRDTAAADQGRHAEQRRAAATSPSTPTRSRCTIDGEVVEPDPADRAADGPALLPVLMPATASVASLLLLADGRLPVGRPRALRRPGGGGRRRPGRATRPTLARLPARAGCATDGPGRRRRSPRPPAPRPRRGDALELALDAALDAPHRRRRAPAARRRGARAGAAAHARRGLCRPAASRSADADGPHHPVALGAVAAAAGLRRRPRPRPSRCTTSSAAAGHGGGAPARPRPASPSPPSPPPWRGAPSPWPPTRPTPRRRRRAAVDPALLPTDGSPPDRRPGRTAPPHRRRRLFAS